MLVGAGGLVTTTLVSFAYGDIPGTASDGGLINGQYYFNWHDEKYTLVTQQTWKRAWFLEQLSQYCLWVPIGVLCASYVIRFVKRPASFADMYVFPEPCPVADLSTDNTITNQGDACDPTHSDSCSDVWRWTPVTALGYLGLAGVISILPIHPFFFLFVTVFIIFVIVVICMLCIVLFQSRIAYGILTLAIGTGFAMSGATIAWWLFCVICDPLQQNKLDLVIVLGFTSLACLAIGCSTVTATLLWLLEKNNPSNTKADQQPHIRNHE